MGCYFIQLPKLGIQSRNGMSWVAIAFSYTKYTFESRNGMLWVAISFSYPTNTLQSRNENTVEPKTFLSPLRLETS